MRPVRVIDPEFFAPDEALSDGVPLLDLWMQAQKGAQPLAGTTVLLIQHQLSNQVPMLKALLDLGVRSEDVWWLDIPYTSHPAVRDYAAGQFGVPRSQLLQADYPVLAPYGPYQHARAIRTLRTITDRNPGSLIVLDDGAYALDALAAAGRNRRADHARIHQVGAQRGATQRGRENPGHRRRALRAQAHARAPVHRHGDLRSACAASRAACALRSRG